MIKIIFTVTNDLCFDQRMDRICSALAREGYEVTLVGRKKKASPDLKEKPYAQKRLCCWFNKGKLFYLEYNTRLFFYLLFRKTDIISSVDLDTILPGFIVARLRSKKFAYDAHEYFTEVIEVAHRSAVKKIWLSVEKFVVPRIRHAYTVSEGLKKLFEEKYSTRFEVIRNVPELQEYEEAAKAEKYIIYIGAVNAGRGLEELIEAMPEINSRLYICGDGDIYKDLVKQVVDMKLENKVKFFGYMDPMHLRDMTRKAYIGVLLLNKNSLSYYYSLANKFFDYMHAGIPQVTINFPEYQLINEKHKVAELISLDKKEIVHAVHKLLDNQLYYEELKSNTLKAREEYNWQSESKKLVELYKKMCS
ncbi:MAG: glycosyltransferase [Cytophagaceae bacterium]|nr:glycosyltransferase [Cytophagaceae bacterium]